MCFLSIRCYLNFDNRVVKIYGVQKSGWGQGSNGCAAGFGGGVWCQIFQGHSSLFEWWIDKAFITPRPSCCKVYYTGVSAVYEFFFRRTSCHCIVSNWRKRCGQGKVDAWWYIAVAFFGCVCWKVRVQEGHGWRENCEAWGQNLHVVQWPKVWQRHWLEEFHHLVKTCKKKRNCGTTKVKCVLDRVVLCQVGILGWDRSIHFQCK